MKTLNLDTIESGIRRMADFIIDNEVCFCQLDSCAGDGDFGMSLVKGFKVIKSNWSSLRHDDIGSILKSCGMIIFENCGGASGPIWGSGFRAAATKAKGMSDISLLDLVYMLEASIEKIMKLGGAKLGDKTLLDALIPATESLKASIRAGEPTDELIDNVMEAAKRGAESTKEIVASKGRASYVGERSIGSPDAGAMAVSLIINHIVS